MRKPSRIVLSLMGGLLTAGCSQTELLRNTYNTRDDCVQDYRDNLCYEERTAGTGLGTGRYLGPIYSLSDLADPECVNGPGSGRTNLAVERRVVGRGGFGSTGCDQTNHRLRFGGS